MILACVMLTQYRSVTDGQRDRQTDASMMAKTHVLSRVTIFFTLIISPVS